MAEKSCVPPTMCEKTVGTGSPTEVRRSLWPSALTGRFLGERIENNALCVGVRVGR